MSSEELVQQQIRLDAGRINVDLWRNNVGACVDQSGRLIRYGLANESAKENDKIKSSDLIGVSPLLITPAHVGYYVGVFTAIEVKRSDWTYSSKDAHSVAQLKYIDIVRNAGGFAGFARSVEEFRGIICRS